MHFRFRSTSPVPQSRPESAAVAGSAAAVRLRANFVAASSRDSQKRYFSSVSELFCVISPCRINGLAGAFEAVVSNCVRISDSRQDTIVTSTFGDDGCGRRKNVGVATYFLFEHVRPVDCVLVVFWSFWMRFGCFCDAFWMHFASAQLARLHLTRPNRTVILQPSCRHNIKSSYSSIFCDIHC